MGVGTWQKKRGGGTKVKEDSSQIGWWISHPFIIKAGVVGKGGAGRAKNRKEEMQTRR